MLIAARNGFAVGGKRLPTAKDYVQDGLFRQVDAIENLGYGQHTDTPTAWRDLIQNDDWNIYDAIYENGAFIKKDTTTRPIQIAITQSQVNEWRLSGATIELVVEPGEITRSGCVCGCGYSGPLSFSYNKDNKILGLGGNGIAAAMLSSFDFATPTTFSIVADASETRMYMNGNQIGRTSLYNASNIAPEFASWNSNIGISGNGRTSSSNTSIITNIGYKEFRFYAKPISLSEIAANYAVDKLRFNLP